MRHAPENAPPRPDLTFLRRRARPVAQPAPPVAAPPPAPTPPPPPVVVAPEPVSASLDLGRAVVPPAPTSSRSVSLDLSAPTPAPEPSRPTAPEPVARSPRRTAEPVVASVRRVQPGRPEILAGKAPVVSLTRLQSGIGALTITAACSDAVGDLRLGCAYRLRSGVSSAIQLESGLTIAPPGSIRPILLTERERFETVTMDLRQVSEVDRLLFYAFSASNGEIAWGGTLTITTLGGGRLEIPMDAPKSPGVTPLATIYNVEGELVVRAEPREVCPTVREVCLAFGFDRIAWLDPRTPVA